VVSTVDIARRALPVDNSYRTGVRCAM